MPKSDQRRVTLNGIKYGLSSRQLELIGKKRTKLAFPLPWNVEQRIKGLVGKKLATWAAATSKSVTIERTPLGQQVFKAFQAKVS